MAQMTNLSIGLASNRVVLMASQGYELRFAKRDQPIIGNLEHREYHQQCAGCHRWGLHIDQSHLRHTAVLPLKPTCHSFGHGAHSGGCVHDGGHSGWRERRHPHQRDVSAFYMDTNLVSYSQWQSVYSYATNHGYGFDYAGSGKAANHPVQTVDWYDVVKWSNARSQQAGLTPVYYTDAGLTQVYTNWDVDAVM